MRAHLTSWITAAASLIAMVGVTGCDDELFELVMDPDDVLSEEILDVIQSRSPAQMPADGASLDTIFAVLPKDAAKRVVTFKTTAGRFEHFGLEKTVTTRADTLVDGRLRATVVLIADTIPGTVVIHGAIGDFSDFVEIELLPTPSPGGRP